MVTLPQAFLLLSMLFLRVALSALILCPAFLGAVSGIDFFFLVFNSEINHIKGLIPSLNLIGYSLLEN